jgi:hypothetical protein
MPIKVGPGGTVAVNQNVLADSNNTSDTKLESSNGYTFTGTKTSTLGVAGIQVSLLCDKNCRVQVQQSPDGTNWDLTDTYYYTANESFGITVQAISSYVRVIINTNNETTGTFRTQTALCPIVEAVPRSLDANGNFKVAMGEDEYGFSAENTPVGEQRVIEPIRLTGTSFEGYVIDPNFWTTGATGTSASISQAGSELSMVSGTSNGATVYAYSVRRARYIGGVAMRYRAVIQQSAGTANNIRRWGIARVSNYNFTISAGTALVGNTYTVNSQQFTVLRVVSPTSIDCYGTGAPSASGTLTFANGPGSGNLTYTSFTAQSLFMDGAYFKLSNTAFSVSTIKEGTEVPVTAFNGQLGYSYALPTTATTFEMYWTNSKVWFVIGDQILHIVSAGTATWSNTLSFHVFQDSINSDVATSVTMNVRTATIYRLGKIESAPIWRNINTTAVTALVLKRGAGRLHRVTFNTIPNTTIISLYDGVTATNPIAIMNPPNGATGFTMELGLDFYNGLTITTTPNNADVTIVYE